jgi:hypothetical protein
MNNKYDDQRNGKTSYQTKTNYLYENGKIIRSLIFYNEADVLRQLGYKFVPAEEAE